MAQPLADRIRPKTLDEVVGQQHLLGKNMPLRRIVESGKIPNMIFYGSSGIGKTTVARIIAENSNMKLCKLNGTTASISDIKDIIAQIENSCSESIEKTAEKLSNALIGSKKIFLFGTGHSHMLAEELFYRAGGLLNIQPVLIDTLMLHIDAAGSTEAERKDK